MKKQVRKTPDVHLWLSHAQICACALSQSNLVKATLNSQSFYLNLWSTGITAMYHCDGYS